MILETENRRVTLKMILRKQNIKNTIGSSTNRKFMQLAKRPSELAFFYKYFSWNNKIDDNFE